MKNFASFDDLKAACLDLPTGNPAAAAAVASREARLTKPAGALGRLEEIVSWLAYWQGKNPPRLDRVEVLVFAGNHGVTAQGVSAYPAEVTAQMVANFAAGGAAINQLARLAGASLRVIALALDTPTADFTIAPAMDERAFLAAVTQGCQAVSGDADLICLGEMGIGNTTSAAALAAALFGGGAERFAGRGAGLDDVGLARKRAVIDAA
ncbi:MAG: nicotinate-nucleotide--dimethylbenzimidazole phosphoribosyltransferase, partial [Rhodoplanes sp.]